MAKLIDTKGLEVFKGLIEDQIPENLSELSNDTGFITADDIPTKLSEFENDPGFLTDSDMSGYADKNYVDQKVSDLVNSAPEALDTLKELADALGNDKDFASTVTTELGKKANDESVLHKGGQETITGNKTVKYGTSFKFDAGSETITGMSSNLYVEEMMSEGTFVIKVPDSPGYLASYSDTVRKHITGPKLVFDFSKRTNYRESSNSSRETFSKFELHTGSTQYAWKVNDKYIINHETESKVLKGEVTPYGGAKLTWAGCEIFDTRNYETWVKNSTITIKRNGGTLGSFTLNQAADKTLNIEVPTKLSELENDLDLLTAETVAGMIAAAMPIAITNDEIDAICVRA